MIHTPSSQDIERFRSAVARRLGLQFDDDRLGMAGRCPAVPTRHCRAASDLISCPPGNRGSVCRARRTGAETHGCGNALLPQRRSISCVRANGPARSHRFSSQFRSLRILSAGCASGEEAYSIAILIRDSIDPAWHTSILGVDVNPEMVRKASRGRYSAWALRETPADIRQRWFTAPRAATSWLTTVCGRRSLRRTQSRAGRSTALAGRCLRHRVLQKCAHVLHEGAREDCHGAHQPALKPAGYLFLGHAETLRGISDDFQLKHTPRDVLLPTKGWSAAPGAIAAVPPPSRSGFCRDRTTIALSPGLAGLGARASDKDCRLEPWSRAQPLAARAIRRSARHDEGAPVELGRTATFCCCVRCC